MKTLVIFRLPGAGHQYLYCSADELASMPQRGNGYECDDRMYTITRVYECLRKPGGNIQLMKLLKAFEKTDDGVAAAIANMLHVGKSAPKGGIVTASMQVILTLAQDIVGAHDCVILVCLVADAESTPAPEAKSLSETLSDMSKTRRGVRKDRPEGKNKK